MASMNVTKLALSLLFASAAAAAAQTTRPATQATTRPTKQLYIDAGLHLPTIRARIPPGFLPAIVEAGGRYFAANGKQDSYFVGGYGGPTDEIIPGKLRSAVVGLPPGTLYIYDQERPTWSTDIRSAAPDVVEKNKRRYREFATVIHEANPLARVAFYGILPIGDYWTLTRQFNARRVYEKWKAGATLTGDESWAIGHAYSWDGRAWVLNDAIADHEGRADFLKWQRANDNDTVGTRDDGTVDPAGGIVQTVDALTPSLYDFYAGNESEGYVAETIAEARRLAGGRPVYPFVWPCYHNSNPTVGGQTIPLDEWRQHVRWILRQADGCVLWGADPIKHREHIRVLQEEAELASREADLK